MKQVLTLITVLVASFMISNVHAHADHGKPQYGGVVAEGGVFQAELVATSGKLTLYVTDHGKAVDTKGATAKLTVLAGGKKTELQLAPAGGNKLDVALTDAMPALPKGARVVGVLTVAGSKAVSMQWTMK
jgi:hypothetical protein